MVKGLKNESLRGRNFALTIILGVFIAIMVIVLINLTVSYVYPGPEYEDYCSRFDMGPYPVKANFEISQNCSYSKVLQEKVDVCAKDSGFPVYEYDNLGCTIDLKECDLCQKNFENDLRAYNRMVFFVYAVVGFILIILGLFLAQLLLQLVTLPAGAFLVIEAAMKNFDDKLLVIITFALLIVLAIVLALKKLK